VVVARGAIYGTTYSGGKHGVGTIFRIDLHTGKERVLHDFGACDDGANPAASLIASGGRLYGTTVHGGTSGGQVGTVFSIAMNGTAERLLHAFAGGDADAAYPSAPVTMVNGSLFGTTSFGGYHCNCGTIFRIDSAGSERLIYTFAGAVGAEPYGGLTYSDGLLYGATTQGVASLDGGTCFRLRRTAGTFTRFISFSPSTTTETGLRKVSPSAMGRSSALRITAARRRRAVRRWDAATAPSSPREALVPEHIEPP
jgi:uncharacterized repeat protein (TIGR03803 family)